MDKLIYIFWTGVKQGGTLNANISRNTIDIGGLPCLGDREANNAQKIPDLGDK